MKKKIAIAALVLCSQLGFAQKQVAKNASINIFSETPIENIDGTSKSSVSAINTSNNAIYFKCIISTISFDKALMQEHFNENYMESDKYPNAEFTGKINEAIDWTKDGKYNVTVSGDLSLHGITKAYNSLAATIVIAGGKVSGNAVFMVKCADHKISIPKLLVKNIAETIRVTVQANYEPFTK
jgi:hypothetical protein